MKKVSLFGRGKKRQTDNILQERKHLIFNTTDFFILEAYKSLRTNVLFSLAGENENNVIIVTSAMQSEGKSTTATNLAITFAQNDKRVLLVDCDMRRPKLGRLLGQSAELGLSDILLEPERCAEAISSTPEKNLKVLLAGAIPPNPSELLSSRRMKTFLEAMKKQFDLIILDAPPINVVTDAMVLCPESDGVLFVVRAGQSERGAVVRAVDLLEHANAKLLGFVLNGADGQIGSHGSYRNGGYGYSSSANQG